VKQSPSTPPQYIVVRVFSNQELTQISRVQNVEIFAIRGDVDKALERKIESVFVNTDPHLSRIKIKNDGDIADFEIPTGSLRHQFVILNIFFNSKAIPASVSVKAHRGDVVYMRRACEGDCHRVEIRNASITKDQEGKISTGYNELDSFILNK
jgi:hypothetical protein